VVVDTQTASSLQERERTAYAAIGSHAYLAIPLITGGRLTAIFVVEQSTPRHWTAAEITLVEEAAARTGAAVEHARAAAALQISETRLRLAVEAGAIGIWDIDLRSGVRTWSDQGKAIYGLAAHEPMDYERQLALIHPDDRAHVHAQVTAFRDQGTLSHLDFEHRIVRPDGSLCWVAVRGEAIYEDGPLPVRLIGTLVDITESKRAEEALRDSEARYRQLANAMPQLVWTSDPGGVVDYYNSRVAEYATLVHTGDGSWNWQPMLHPDDLQPTLAAWRMAARSGQLYAFEHRIQMNDGSFRWHLSRALPVSDADGRIIKWFGTATDIHEQKQIEHDSRLLADIGERIRLATHTEELLDQVAQLVGEYLKVRRYMVIEIDLAHNRGMIHCEYCRGVPSVAHEYAISDYSTTALAEIAEGRTIVNNDSQIDPRTAAIYEATYRPNGERAYIAVPLMRDGRWNGTLWVSDDMPRQWEPREIALLETVAERIWLAVEKLRTEQALRASEERLQVLYAQEQAARAQAEAASRLKDEFLATVSHELRTPLTSILGYGQMIQTRKRDETYTVRTIEKIVRSAKAQAQLIDDLLDVSRIVTGKLRLEPRPIDIVTVIQAAIEALRPAIDAKGIRLDTELHSGVNTIVGDPNRLQQVVWNLLSNAVKFTPSGGKVRICLESQDGHAQLTISDTGQGISAEFLPFVFDRFRQAESASNRTHGGLGLGLAIVRHLIEMHGGTVQVQSAGAGTGATFIVRLPLVAGAVAANGGAPEAQDTAGLCPPALDGVRVLVVDDQSDIVELLQDMLAPCGAVVRTTTAARDALATLRTWQPDVLVSDIAMPGEDGYWLIDHVRALTSEKGGAIPAVALTAYVRVEDRMRVLAAGFQLYVSKPVDPAELLDAVARLAEIQPLADET
jgi:PAS domain S-box-containing protein